MSFTDLGVETRLATQLSHQGITQPTDIQAQAIPHGLRGDDIFAQSKTGSGKTLAFLLPAVQRVMKQRALSKRDPRVVILAPTRELVTQVYNQCRLLIAGTNYKAVKVVGGENFNDQVKALARDPHFVVATPGRLADHVKQKTVFLTGLELLIFDEADRMLDLGFKAELDLIAQEANHRLRQTMLFSATLKHSEVDVISRDLLKSPTHIEITQAHSVHGDITEQFILADHLEHKEALMHAILAKDTVQQAIVFTATRADTVRLAALLKEAGLDAIALSGDDAQNKRLAIMDAFSRGLHKVLVTTDVASRGLDLLNVSHVLNFDLPKHAEEYVHRIGRTGRAGFKGDAFSFVSKKDWQSFERLRDFLKRTIEFSDVPGLVAEFKGFKPRKPVKKKAPAPKKAAPHNAKAKPKTRKPKRAAAPKPQPFDVDGMAPLKRKPKPSEGEPS